MHLFDGLLAHALVTSYERTGSANFAWRLVRFLHALPFLGFAFAFGWVDGMVWDVSPLFTAVFCSGLVFLGMCVSWFREWRRGY
jgi:hypothetical protein